MLSGFNNLINGLSRKAEGLSDTQRTLILGDMLPLDKLEKGLSRDARDYVAEGLHPEVLLKIASFPNVGEILGVGRFAGFWGIADHRKCAERKKIFESRAPSLPGEVLHRYGELFHSARYLGKSPNSSGTGVFPDEVRWLATLMEEVASLTPEHERAFGSFFDNKRNCVLSGPALEDALMAAGQSPDWVVRCLMVAPDWAYLYDTIVPSALVAMDEVFARHDAAVIDGLNMKEVNMRIRALGLVDRYKAPITPGLQKALEKLLVGSSKAVREEVEKFLVGRTDAKQKALVSAEEFLKSGASSQSLVAVDILSRWEPDRAVKVFGELLKSEKRPRIRTEMERFLTHGGGVVSGPQEESVMEEDSWDLPHPKSFEAAVQLTPEAEKEFYTLIETYNRKAIELHAKWWDSTPPEWRRREKRYMAPPIDPSCARRLLEGMVDSGFEGQGKPLVNAQMLPKFEILSAEIETWFIRNEVSVVGVIRLASMLGILIKNKDGSWWGHWAHEWIKEWIGVHGSELNLLDLADASRVAGVDSDWIAACYLELRFYEPLNPLGLAQSRIWPYFAGCLDAIEYALGLREIKGRPVSSYLEPKWKEAGYAVLRDFPRAPRSLLSHLWSVALGERKTYRVLAQQCLLNEPNLLDTVHNALEDARKSTRVVAAEWLTGIRSPDSIKVLKKALASEKHDEPKAAMMMALEALGVDMDQFLNRKKLLEEAQNGLKKGMPKDLEWFPVQQIPVVHWEKNRQPVAPEILQWMLVQTCKVKNPEPTPLIRRYCALMDPQERSELGAYVLKAWLHQDTLPKYTQEEAQALSDQTVDQYRGYAKQHPAYYESFDFEALRKNTYANAIRTCAGSANPSKGILAIAGACCGADIVPLVHRYLKDWFGGRLHQCKALIQMLSWIDHPVAIQLLLTIGTRFRTKSIQEEAAKCVDSVAERKGWTRDELADRTIPTAGFESDGTQVIDYGMRQFTARMLADFSIELQNADGKSIKVLPDANQAENEEEVKSLKKTFSASKKELQQVLKQQKERLYEAMCTERRWRFEDWSLYLNQHPIVGRYCQQLVWMTVPSGDESYKTFRPLPDRTLTDAGDNPVELDADTLVRLSHGSLLTGKEADEWKLHFSDYEVEPLFVQFGDKGYNLPEGKESECEIKDFEGHMVNTFKLRSRATKLGYSRGPAEDGGWFMTYLKAFPGLDLQAVIEFTGNSLPEENRMAALISLSFIPLKRGEQDSWSGASKNKRLKEVPVILLSECFNDMRLMAADGSGYDPEWQDKGYAL